MTSQPDPKDGPSDNACEVNLTGADPLVRDSQPDRGAIVQRYLRWRWGSLAKVTDEARVKAEQDYDFWAAALRVLPPEGGPRAEDVLVKVICRHCQRVTIAGMLSELNAKYARAGDEDEEETCEEAKMRLAIYDREMLKASDAIRATDHWPKFAWPSPVERIWHLVAQREIAALRASGAGTRQEEIAAKVQGWVDECTNPEPCLYCVACEHMLAYLKGLAASHG